MSKNFVKNLKQNTLPKPIGCIIALGIVGIFIMFLVPFIKVLPKMYHDTPTRGRAIFIGILLIVLISFIIKVRKIHHLDNAIEKGTAIRKTVKIVDFKFGYKSETEHYISEIERESTFGYYVIVSDGQKCYKGMFHRGAKIYGKSEEELMNDNFYIKEGITLDLNNRDLTRQQLDQRISELRLENNGVNLLKILKSAARIKKIENKKHDLELYHLHTYEGDFYIGDEYTILIDPDDSSNYTFENVKV